MKKRRRSPLFFFLLVVLLIEFTGSVRQLRQQMRQTQINRQLVLAVHALSVSQVQDCLRAGADPNMPRRIPQQPTFWQVFICLFHPSLPQPTLPQPTKSGDRVLADVLDSASHSNSPEQQRQGCRIAVLLIQFGANPQCDDFSPLSTATWIRANDVTQALVEHGADVNMVDVYGNRPLLNAADKFSPSGLLLLAHGADPNARHSISRMTPLMEAAGSGNTALVRALLEKRADLTLKDVRGKTALDFAREYNRGKIVDLLKQADAKE